jgi:hypothetical protein
MSIVVESFELARAEEMLRGYSARWFDEPLEVLAVEKEFHGDLVNPETGAKSQTFGLGGKIDAVVWDRVHGRTLIVEHKSSSEDCSPGSVYWRRLTLNEQLSTYQVGARLLGFEPDGILYDVLVKPGIRPASVPLVDADGVKIVLDAANERVRTKDGKKWRETGDTNQGFVLQTRPETIAEFRARLQELICERPDEYYRRGDIVRLADEEREAAFDAWQTAAAIREGRRAGRYPRNPDSCLKYSQVCTFFDVCTGQASLEDPTRFRRVDDVHEELSPAASRRRLPLLTSSQLSAFRSCQRMHYYRYDLGYRALESSEVQRFGTLIHRGLEGWWLAKKDGAGEVECLERALDIMRTPKPALAKTAAPAAREAVVL